MTDHERDSDRADDPRLRPIIARLREIERKCRSLGPRNDEAAEMAARLEAVVKELSGGDPPPNYAQLAQRLFPVARLFESLGFMSVAKEVAHVDRLLTELGSDTPTPAPRETPTRPRQAVQITEPIPDSDLDRGDLDADVGDDRPRTPPAVIAGLAVLVIALIAAATIILRFSPGDDEAARATASWEATTTSVEPTASLAPQQRPGFEPAGRPPVGQRSRLADLIGEARLAHQAGNLDEAISLVSQAGSIDPKATAVLETAAALVDELVLRADRAAGAAEWQAASDLLERARELAVRFELSTRPIDAAVHRQGTLERYQRLRPEDRPALRSVIGSRVVVLTDADPYEGTLVGVDTANLRLELGLEIGDNGALIHTVDVPMASVREVRVYPAR